MSTPRNHNAHVITHMNYLTERASHRLIFAERQLELIEQVTLSNGPQWPFYQYRQALNEIPHLDPAHGTPEGEDPADASAMISRMVEYDRLVQSVLRRAGITREVKQNYNHYARAWIDLKDHVDVLMQELRNLIRVARYEESGMPL